jgi:hypothetical protein
MTRCAPREVGPSSSTLLLGGQAIVRLRQERLDDLLERTSGTPSAARSAPVAAEWAIHTAPIVRKLVT